MGDLIRAFLTVFPAELPDKSMVATIVLVARYRRPLAVWVGAAAAFAIHVVVAVAAGSAIGLLPERVVGTVVVLLFAAGAVVLFRSARAAEAEATDEVLREAERVAHALDERSTGAGSGNAHHHRTDPEVDPEPARAGPSTGVERDDGAGPTEAFEALEAPGADVVPARRAATGAFGIIVLAEWGDLTQLATASLAASSGSPPLTGLGAFLALGSVAAIAASVGRQAVARIPLHRINYVSAAIFAALAVWTAVEVLA